MTGDQITEPVGGEDSLSTIADSMVADEGGEESADELLPGESDEDVEAVEEESDEDEEDPESEDEGGDEPTFTIKHDGKEVSLTKSELIEMGQRGFDYTAKTMAVAEERKAVEAERGKVTEVVSQHEQALQATQQRLQAFTDFVRGQVGNPPDISLAHQNAAQYLALKEAHEAQKGQLQQALAEVQAVEEERARLRQAQRAYRADQTWNELRDTLPGWKEDMDGKFDALAKYTSAAGLNAETAGDAILHKGFWELAHKAQQFDKLQEEKSKLKPKEQLRRVEPPKAARQTTRGEIKRNEAEKRYNAKPSIESLAALMN